MASVLGFVANDRSYIASYTIPGTRQRIALRKGDVSVILLDFMAWFHREIERIDGGTLDDWGYAERNVRGSTTITSRHAIGGAVDLNALKHPLGKRNTFNADKRARIRAKLREYSGVIRWGGDYVSRPDDMHFEINKGPTACKAVADRIRTKNAPKPVAPPEMKENDDMAGSIGPGAAENMIRLLQTCANNWLAKNAPSEVVLTVDGDYGKNTRRVMRLIQTGRFIGIADLEIASPGVQAYLFAFYAPPR